MEAPENTSVNGVLEAFDAVAPVFDEELENVITRRIRTLIYAEIETLLPRGGSVLDINCGTGTDMLYLLEHGYEVVGNDLSPLMIVWARKKILQQFPGAQFYNSSFERLDRLPLQPFDLVFSNFGGLNCVRDLSVAAKQIASVVKPGGLFLGVIMPPVCLWEMSAGLARGNWRRAFRRLGKRTPATGFKGRSFTVYYHTLASVKAAFRPWFRVRRIFGLSVFSSPPHAMNFYRSFPRLSQRLERIDALLSGVPLFRAVGDHTAVVLEKKSSQ